jgi:site-specific DNA recombinase
MPEPAKRAVVYLRVSTLEQTQTALDDKGYSIHAQEAACRARAMELGYSIVDVYIDRAESARSANRPALQAMLTRLRVERDVQAVIVYKVDRLARNRLEDGLMLAEIQAAGALLLSVTENIDATPAGRLMHGVLATIAEYEVANLGTRTLMGMDQKAKMGGTPGRAPIGYLNVRQTMPDGREIRSVIVDEERAPHVQWAFREYATGEWSLTDLVEALDERGLRSVPTRSRATPRPLSRSQLSRMLGNPYYAGKVRWKDEVFDGTHDALISQSLFDHVQLALEAKHISGTRRRVHEHYLKGSLTCRHCQGRMFLSMAKNRHGTVYPYFFCRGRRDGHCQLPYIAVDQIERRVEGHYASDVHLTEHQITRLLSYLRQEIELTDAEARDDRLRQIKRIERLSEERRLLLGLYYDGDLSRELFREEQRRIDADERQARLALEAASTNLLDVVAVIEKTAQLLHDWRSTYGQADDLARRRFNQLFFQTIYVHSETETELGFAAHVEALLEADQILHDAGWEPGQPLLPPGPSNDAGFSPKMEESPTRTLAFAGTGSHKTLLVPRTGFEPVLPP